MFQLNEAVKHNTAKLDETLTKVNAIKIFIVRHQHHHHHVTMLIDLDDWIIQ